MKDAATIVVKKDGNVSLKDESNNFLAPYAGKYTLVSTAEMLIALPYRASQFKKRPGEKLALAGDLSAMPMVNLLNAFGQNQESGRLVVLNDEAEKVVILRDGDIASIGSNAAEDRLGHFLLRMNKISEEQLERALTEALSSNVRFGQILLQHKWINPHDLWECISEQITELFSEVANLEQGSFVFYQLSKDFIFPSTPPLPMGHLLLEALRRADEMEHFKESLQGLHAWIKRSEKEIPKKGINELENSIIKNLSKEAQQIKNIAKLSFLSDFNVMQGIYNLLKLKVVEIVPAPENNEENALPTSLGDKELDKVRVYNLAFREIRDEILRNDALEVFAMGVMKYLSNPKGPYHSLFKGIALLADGTFDPQKLKINVESSPLENPVAQLFEALRDLTFFMLFQCGELLDRQSDDNLGRRVRLIHSTLKGSKTITQKKLS